ncbi:DNA recombination protein RmuC [Microbacterium sp. NPDC089698]|uniref:DNA recombination protein RmuC n=1 Tax=Microbacterium sp. NPDC089698 TaxID=3364200 RepID=UPI0038141884
MDALALLIAALTAVAGLALGWFLGRSRGAADLARADAELAVVREDRDRQNDLYRDAVEHARREQHDAAERVRQENAVLTALAPVRESLHRMQQTVTVLERERHAQFGQLSEQLRRTEESGEALRSTTESLAGALRSTSARGVWGETQLRRVVEAAGLTRHVDFDLQATIHSDAGHGRPDMVIRLAGGASIAVDAKAPLDAFLAAGALGSEDPQRRSLMQQHVKAVRSHIDALAKKAYWSGLEVSPEFVICFLPTESLLSAALDEDPALLDYAFNKRVALATPVNLWAVLKTVAYTWKQQELSAEAAVLLDLGTQLYDRLGVLAGHADDLRRALERTVDSYNRFAGSLESRVLVTARRFPGVDADVLTAPTTLTASTRRFTADELASSADAGHAEGIRADLGELRARLSGQDADAPARIDRDSDRGEHHDRTDQEEVTRSREPR